MPQAHMAELRRLGLKGTTQRAIILEVLEQSGRHLSADEVAAAVAERHLQLSRSTIYRTLEALAGVGILRASRMGRATFYELSGEGHDHHHGVCSNCHRTVHLPGAKVDALVAREASAVGFTPAEIQLVVTGLCAACREAGSG